MKNSIKRSGFVALLSSVFWSGCVCSEEGSPIGLYLTHATSRSFCGDFAELLRDATYCRTADANCSDDQINTVVFGGAKHNLFVEIASNHFGYSSVYTSASSPPVGKTVVYLYGFRGDKHQPLYETWLVDSNAWKSSLALKPEPRKITDGINNHASAFTEVLKTGAKISSEWSPIVSLAGTAYALERECSGYWSYGGDYHCNRVIKFTIKKLSDRGNPVGMCQFSYRKSKNR